MREDTALNQRFHDMIAQHQGILFKVARTYCAHETDRQDLVQEMMIQIWKALPNYKLQYAISTWVYRIALNVAISFYRKNTARHQRYATLDDHAGQWAEQDKSDQQDQLHQLEQFISLLDELDKALMLLYLEDRSQAEISDILGISVSNVSTKVGRIKDKLKKQFSNLNS